MHEHHHQRPTSAAAIVRLTLLAALAAVLPGSAAAQTPNPMCSDSGEVVHPGEVRAGKLTSTSCRTASGQYYHAYLLVLTSPQELAVIHRSADGAVNPVIRIERAGKSVQRDTSSGRGEDARIAGQFDEGTWRIVAMNATPRQGGSFELSIEPTGPGAKECARRVIALGDRRRGNFGPGSCRMGGNGPFVAYHRMTLTAPTAVELTLESADFSPTIRLYEADGSRIEREEGASVANIRKLLQPGAYLIEASPNSGDGVGDYELSVTAVAAVRGGDCKPADADDRFEVGEQLKGDLTRNDCSATETSTDIRIPANYHRLEVGRNQRIRLELRTGLEDARLELHDEKGRWVGSDRDTMFARVARGIYYVRVSAPTRGGYTLVAERDEKTAGDTDCGMASAWDVLQVGRTYTRRFEATSCDAPLGGYSARDVMRLEVKTAQTVTITPRGQGLHLDAEIADAQGNRLRLDDLELIKQEIRTNTVTRQLTPGTYFIEVSASAVEKPGGGYSRPVGEYQLAIGPEIPVTSSIRGLYFSGGYGSSWNRAKGGDEWHALEGWTAQAGIGLTSRILLFGQMSNDANDPSEDVVYDLVSRDVGARFYFLGNEMSFMRLSVEGTYGTREDVSRSGQEFKGRGWRGGMGYELFKGPFTFRWTGTYGEDKYTEVRFNGQTVKIDDSEQAFRQSLGLSLRIPF